MKPLKLTMQAFGPFPSKIEIDFEKLGSGNIYLISGVTGSGKTTIFDAICYALFNSSSGQNRGNATFKSHYANDETISFVEFEFLFNCEKYVVLRQPAYERKKSRGSGFIQEQATAQITLPNGKIIEKPKEVDEYIKELLGLNVSQFSQIALLAQGEFLKLLNADSQSRSEVFRNIFKTWNYANFQNQLKDRAILYKNEYENLKNSLIQYISDISTDNDKLLALKENYISNNCFDNLKELISLLEIQNKSDDYKLEEIKKNILEIENKNNLLQKDFINIKTKLNIEKQKDEISAELSKLEKDYILINKKNTKANSKLAFLDELNHLIKKNDENCKKSIEIKKLNSELALFETNLETEKNLLLNLEKNLNKLKSDFLQYSYNKYQKQNEKLKEIQTKFLDFQKLTEAKSLNYTKNYNQYLKQQAGVLALNLVENEPCPVCGSLKHPNIAKITNQKLTKEFLDTLKSELDEDNLKLSDYASEASKINEQVKILNENYVSLKKRFQIDTLRDSVKIEEISFEEEIAKSENKIKDKNSSITKISQDIIANKTKTEFLLKDFNGKNIEQVIIYQEKLINRYNYLSDKIKSAQNIFLETEIKKTNLTAQIDLYKKQLTQYSKINTNEIKSIEIQINDLKEKLITLNETAQNILIRTTLNNKILNTIKNKNKEYIKISNLYADYKILSDCANGNLKGSARIPFEQYIQGYYLDMVLYEANKHLKIMTQNQFQLLRKKEVMSLQSKTALDLEVIDFHTFKKRSTKTLSGGESFKAALSLALGLSDCVSNFSGAINIDAMFIDEGFGSLDSESLELAMDVIFALSTNNRLIGIISHIDDLKNKIQNQILTKKSDKGSSLEVNF